MTCTITPPNDPNSGNNVYSEIFSQPAVVTATVPVITYDLAGTDLYRDNTPKGKVWVRITSNDPGHLQDIGVQLACSAVAKEYVGGAKTTIAVAPRTILVPLNPGQTAAYDTGISIDTSKYWYEVSCSISSNDTYSETIPPPPKICWEKQGGQGFSISALGIRF